MEIESPEMGEWGWRYRLMKMEILNWKTFRDRKILLKYFNFYKIKSNKFG